MLNLIEMAKFSKMVENPIVKAEIACHEEFLIFQKTCAAET